MIHWVDEAVKALLVAEALPETVEVEFNAPTREWASTRTGPTVSLFLYDIHEEAARRDVARATVRESGRVVARPLPPIWVRLSYLLTAWTSEPEDEHRVLAQLLSCVLSHDILPSSHLPPELAVFEVPIVMQAALPPTQDRSISDIWSALGGELKPSIDLQIIAPLQPGDRYELAPLVEHALTVQLHDSSAEPPAGSE